jgi:hypothetical protein
MTDAHTALQEARSNTMHPHPLIREELVRQHREDLLRDAGRRHTYPYAVESRRWRWPRAILRVALRRTAVPAPNVSIGGFSQWAT